MSEERDQTPPDDGDDIEDIDLGAVDGDGNEIDPPEPEPDDTDPDPELIPDESRERRQQVRRGQVHRLRADLDRERAEKADLVRRIAALEQQRSAPPPPDPQAQVREEAEFRASLEQMLPHEAALAVANRSEQRMQRQLAAVALQGFDRSDTADWRRLQAERPAAVKHAAQVEQILQQRRAMGDYTLGRKDILAHLVGMEVLDRPAAASPPRRTRQQRPASGRGDVAAAPAGRGRRSDADQDVALLRGITTADI
jgi:hypothetical protein